MLATPVVFGNLELTAIVLLHSMDISVIRCVNYVMGISRYKSNFGHYRIRFYVPHFKPENRGAVIAMYLAFEHPSDSFLHGKKRNIGYDILDY